MVDDDYPAAVPLKPLYRKVTTESTSEGNSRTTSQLAFQSPSKKTECTCIFINLHGSSLPCKFQFPFDQLSEIRQAPQLLWIKCHWLVMKLLYPVNYFFVVISKNKGRKEYLLQMEPRFRALFCHLGPFPALVWSCHAIITGCTCYWSAPIYLLNTLSFHWLFVP